MAPDPILLRAPSGSPIVGALTWTGEVCPCTCRFARAGGESHFFYEFPEGRLNEIPSSDDQFRLVDETGIRWTRAEVEWESMPPK